MTLMLFDNQTTRTSKYSEELDDLKSSMHTVVIQERDLGFRSGARRDRSSELNRYRLAYRKPAIAQFFVLDAARVSCLS